MAKQNGGRARSLYRQVRLTFTEEITGRLSYSIYGKGLNDEWHQHSVLERGYVEPGDPLRGLEDVKAALIRALETSQARHSG